MKQKLTEGRYNGLLTAITYVDIAERYKLTIAVQPPKSWNFTGKCTIHLSHDELMEIAKQIETDDVRDIIGHQLSFFVKTEKGFDGSTHVSKIDDYKIIEY